MCRVDDGNRVEAPGNAAGRIDAGFVKVEQGHARAGQALIDENAATAGSLTLLPDPGETQQERIPVVPTGYRRAQKSFFQREFNFTVHLVNISDRFAWR